MNQWILGLNEAIRPKIEGTVMSIHFMKTPCLCIVLVKTNEEWKTLSLLLFSLGGIGL